MAPTKKVAKSAKSTSASKPRNFPFTLNNYTEDDYKLLLHDTPCRYVVIGKEIGDEGTPHLQGYMCFSTQHSLSSLKSIHRQVHWEAKSKKSTHAHCRNYCIKDGKFEERGDMPADPKDKGDAEAAAWQGALDAVREGRLDDVRPDILCRNLKQIEYAVKRIERSKRKLVDLDYEIVNEWVYGPTRTGKSKYARGHDDVYIKLSFAKWWDDYAGQATVVIEDVDQCASTHVGLYKLLLDRYVFRVETKGSSELIRPPRSETHV